MSTNTLEQSPKVDHIERGAHGRASKVVLKKGFMLADAPGKRSFPIKTVEEGHKIVRDAKPVADTKSEPRRKLGISSKPKSK